MSYSQWINQNPDLVNQAMATYQPRPVPQYQTAQMPQGNNALGTAQAIYGGVKSLSGGSESGQSRDGESDGGSAASSTQVASNFDSAREDVNEIKSYQKDDDGTGLGGILGLVGKLV